MSPLRPAGVAFRIWGTVAEEWLERSWGLAACSGASGCDTQMNFPHPPVAKRKLEKSVHFDEFESVAEYTPGSHTAALGIPCLQSPTKRTALQNRRVDEPVTPAKELLAHPSKRFRNLY